MDNVGFWLGFSFGALVVMSAWAFFRHLIGRWLAGRVVRPRSPGHKPKEVRAHEAQVMRKFGRL